MDKESFDTKDFAKWLVGAALVGAGGRGLLSLTRSGSKGYKPVSDFLKTEPTIPVQISPEQYKKYRKYRKSLGLDDRDEKRASNGDGSGFFGTSYSPLLYTLGGALGLGSGWSIADKFINKHRHSKLDNRIEKLKKELEYLRYGDDEEVEKVSECKAVYDWLDVCAEVMTGDTITKEAGTGSASKSLSRIMDIVSKHPVASSLGGVGGATALSGFAPRSSGLNIPFNLSSATVPSAAGVGSSIVKNTGKGVLYALGPIMAVMGLSHLSDAYDKYKSKNKRNKELEEFRKSIAKTYAGSGPSPIRLVPKVGSDIVGFVNDMFAKFISDLPNAEVFSQDPEMSEKPAIIPPKEDQEIPPPSPTLLDMMSTTPEAQQIQAIQESPGAQPMAGPPAPPGAPPAPPTPGMPV